MEEASEQYRRVVHVRSEEAAIPETYDARIRSSETDMARCQLMMKRPCIDESGSGWGLRLFDKWDPSTNRYVTVNLHTCGTKDCTGCKLRAWYNGLLQRQAASALEGEDTSLPINIMRK